MDGVGASLSLVTTQISSLMHNLHSLTSNVISNAIRRIRKIKLQIQMPPTAIQIMKIQVQ